MSIAEPEVRRKPPTPVPSEETWNQFLLDLRAWELNKLHVLGELNMHDQYMNGTMPLMDIFVLVCIEGDEKREGTLLRNGV